MSLTSASPAATFTKEGDVVTMESGSWRNRGGVKITTPEAATFFALR
jgi:hypothetical protein